MHDGAENNTVLEDVATRPLTVMQVLPALVTGGVERGAIDIAAALVNDGGRGIVVSAGGPMAHDLTRAGAEHIELPVDSKNPFVIRKNINRLAHLIRANNVDIIHARSRAPAWSAYFAAQKTGIQFITTFHGTYNLGPPLKKWYNSVMTRGDRVIAISEFIARHIVDTYQTKPERIQVIHRGVDFNVFDPAKVSAERIIKMATDWRLPDGVPIIMLPGRLTQWKGQEVLIKALSLLQRDDVRCLIVGSADQGRTRYARRLQSLVDRYSLGSIVHIVGECRDMPAALMLADVVVHASTDPEAFGRVIVEAQAMGRPVVASDHGASRELVEPGETGWLSAPGDAESLASALRKTLNLSAKDREIIAKKARIRAHEQFSKTAMCDATLDTYRSLLADQRALR
jgi:glycosyltransferase involved in cell wall biosynthesis